MSQAVLPDPWPPFLPQAALLACEGEQRREAGRLHFSEALLFLLRHVSHPQLSELADWACNEPGNLHTSQISHMRNNKVRMLGTKALDALGRINQAAWIQRHRPECMEHLGCGPLSPRLRQLLEAYQPLVDPISQEPLGCGGFMAIYLGYLRLPIERPRSLTAEEARQLAGRLGEWLDGELSARGWGIREASRRLQQAWTGEKAGAERLVRVIGGLEDYGAKQLAEDWERISMATAAVLERDDLDPWRLAEILLGSEAPAGQTPAAVVVSAEEPVEAPAEESSPKSKTASPRRQRRSSAGTAL
jgi:hypothetical protein